MVDHGHVDAILPAFSGHVDLMAVLWLLVLRVGCTASLDRLVAEHKPSLVNVIHGRALWPSCSKGKHDSTTNRNICKRIETMRSIYFSANLSSSRKCIAISAQLTPEIYTEYIEKIKLQTSRE